MTLTALEETADEVPVDRDAVRWPLSWRAALWSVVSVRWAAVALALFLAGLTAQLNGAAETVWWTLYLTCYLTVLALWDLLGQLPLPLGVAGHEGSTMIVALHGLRLYQPVLADLCLSGSITGTRHRRATLAVT